MSGLNLVRFLFNKFYCVLFKQKPEKNNKKLDLHFCIESFLTKSLTKKLSKYVDLFVKVRPFTGFKLTRSLTEIAVLFYGALLTLHTDYRLYKPKLYSWMLRRILFS